MQRKRGEVRDAIFQFYAARGDAPATVLEVWGAVEEAIGKVSRSTVNSYLWRYAFRDYSKGDKPPRFVIKTGARAWRLGPRVAPLPDQKK